MYKYSKESLKQLETCDPRLQAVFKEVLKYVDHTIIEGHRGEALQNKYKREGRSGKSWPNGEHNKIPSRAVDAMVYPIDWSNAGIARQCVFAGIVIGVAATMGIKIRWGGDWDGDFNLKEHSLFDTPHFEVVD